MENEQLCKGGLLFKHPTDRFKVGSHTTDEHPDNKASSQLSHFAFKLSSSFVQACYNSEIKDPSSDQLVFLLLSCSAYCTVGFA